ncbi:MAG: Mur ligase [Xanthomonadales bacterium]|nr:Mur ligase [Xanthomonadales bacterium]
MSYCFEDSRRLTGPNLYFAASGAVLDTVGVMPTPAQIEHWRDRVQQARAWLGWPQGDAIVARPHRRGAMLAIAAPLDQLFTATEVNEWAWQQACGRCEMHAPAHPAVDDEASARATLSRSSIAELRPALLALIAAATAHGLPLLWDDEELSIGAGATSARWPMTSLPEVAAVPWTSLARVPVALVSGSNGKTTSVRLIAAMARAQGWFCGHSCTDGLFFNGVGEQGGDYSGPAGARSVLRDARVQAAVLETARGGILRRGLAIDEADVAVVTNVSADHFGEYGIDTLADLADVKLTLARALRPGARIVVNADDSVLRERALKLEAPVAWFALDAAQARQWAKADMPTCGLRARRVVLTLAGVEHDLGEIDALPLTLDGAARYNIHNLLGAALAAALLGVDIAHLRAVMASFGRERADNPGRLQHFHARGIDVLLDYAHNPEGLAGLLELARRRFPQRRLGLVLGQAGNRTDDDIRALADIAADAQPAFIVLKDIDGMLRGRAPGAVPALLQDQLLARGYAREQLSVHLPELDAAQAAMDLARSGDVLVLPIHARPAREAVQAWLLQISMVGVSSPAVPQ